LGAWRATRGNVGCESASLGISALRSARTFHIAGSEGEIKMRIQLNRPSNVVFLVSVVLAVLALIGVLTVIPVLTGNTVLLLAIAYVILALGVLLKGA
jgi:hypothetical protein